MHPLVEPKTRFFDTPNPHGVAGVHRLAFYEWGDVFAPPLVCVHGLTRNGRDFDYLASALSEQYHIIAIDIAGRGLSDPLPDPAWYDNSVYLQDVLALSERLNLAQFDFIGTSMGGIIGMMIAALIPERITHLVLNDIGASIPKTGLERIASYVGKQPSFLSLAEAENTLRSIMQPFGITDETHWQHVLAHSLKQDTNERFTLAYDPAIGEKFHDGLANMDKQVEISLWQIWEHVLCPTLLLRGKESDILTHETAIIMRQTHPDMRLVEWDGIGHAPGLMEDMQINLVQEWLIEKSAFVANH